GFHWYESWSGGRQMFDNIKAVHEAFPDKQLMFTEGCADSYRSDRLQYWPNAERYGESMINDFNNGTAAWTDWNVLLDERGGPNHVANFCFAPVHADTRTGELIYTPSYYYIGHFSKFIRPGARRVGTAPSRSQLLSTSFRNQDGSMVTVVMNTSNAPVTYRLIVGGQTASVTIPSRAIQSLIY
ncbi:MAG: glycosyl hydrolase, partial [Bacteroidetes bacterium]|nr:glycosyl hydrolase [Bacteroidota bacterium]